MQKMARSDIFLYGMGGLGVEIGKHLFNISICLYCTFFIDSTILL